MTWSQQARTRWTLRISQRFDAIGHICCCFCMSAWRPVLSSGDITAENIVVSIPLHWIKIWCFLLNSWKWSYKSAVYAYECWRVCFSSLFFLSLKFQQMFCWLTPNEFIFSCLSGVDDEIATFTIKAEADLTFVNSSESRKINNENGTCDWFTMSKKIKLAI